MTRKVKKILGRLIQLSSLLCIGAALILYVAGLSPKLPVVPMLIAFPAMYVLGILFSFGGRMARPSAEEELRKDPRDPILYLRAFKTDRLTVKRPLLFLQAFLSLPWELPWVLPKVSFEEAIDRILRRYGPTVALSNPSESIAPAGVSRIHVAGEWKEKVIAVAGEAAFVVIIPHNTESVIWEMTEMAKNPGLSRILIILPIEGKGNLKNRSQGWYSEWEELRTKFTHLPPVSDNIAAIWFDETGIPCPIHARSAKAVHQLQAIEDNISGVPALHSAVEMTPSQSLMLRNILSHFSNLSLKTRKIVFYAFWLVCVPLVIPIIRYHDTNFFGYQASLIPFIWNFALGCLLFYIIRKVLPFARLARISLASYGLRVFNPYKRIIGRVHAISMFFLYMCINVFLINSYIVPTGSMKPTFVINDLILVDKRAYGIVLPWLEKRLFSNLPPKRGDVIVFRSLADKKKIFVKRVIGKSGDTVVVENGFPFINGIELKHCFIGLQKESINNYVGSDKSTNLFLELLDEKAYLIGLSGIRDTGTEGPYTVSTEEVFVLGDNRNNSFDSRYFLGGSSAGVPYKNIIGRVIFFRMPKFGVDIEPSNRSRLTKCLQKYRGRS